ncbi:amidohydrolase family protein [Salinibacterium sp. NG253]|uniref:amidohydrolase n=1 Tax=Salinibacterium sp. NG253 TaxID=2792039 RepID=UPI0027DDED80|nr:amidohydrolase family protein [Salinibacterium sp. NG253]
MGKAEVILTGGQIFTGSGQPVTGKAVIVAAGRILDIVPDSAIEVYRNSETRVIELDGKLVAPGFQDAHVHPVAAGVELLQCTLTEAVDADDTLARIATYAAENPEGWICGGGWSMDHFPNGSPARQLLDDVIGDRPVMLSSRDHHSVWASTAAIRAAGLDASTPDPADGRIEREADGFPAGTFHEGAGNSFASVVPEIDDELTYAGLLRAQEELLKLGITGWQDAMIGDKVPTLPSNLPAYRRALDEGTLLAHVVGAQWWERERGRDQIPEMLERRAEIAAIGSDRLQLGTVKIMVDGVAENFTAAMNEPYLDAHGHDTTNSGLSFIDPALLNGYVAELDREGFQVHFHSLGDRAVKEALDALETARLANGATDGRHHLAHLQVVSEEDTARFAPLDAVANLQPLWACHEAQLDELTLPFMQKNLAERQYPFGDLLRHHAKLAAGSDWPVSSADPIAGIHMAVNRVVPESDNVPLAGEQQCLDLATAFAAYTSGSAYVNHRDHDTGSIAAGYRADFVVIEPNPFDVPREEIYRSTVVSTWIDGVEVYSTN